MGQRDEVSEGHEEQGRTELADKDVAVMVQMRDDDAHLHHSAAKSQHVRIETPPPPREPSWTVISGGFEDDAPGEQCQTACVEARTGQHSTPLLSS